MADLRTRIIITSSDQTQAGFNSARGGLATLQNQINQARTALLGFFGISLGAGLIKDLIKTADEFKLLNSAIKLSTRSETEFNRAQEELFAISQRTGTELRSNVDLFRRVSASVRDMGGSQERAFGIIELIGKSVALSGVAAETSAAGIQQFNQGLGSGVLRGEEFNSVMENTPRLAQALADGLKTTKGELRAMAEQGKLTSDVVLKALESQADALNNEFKQVPETIDRALVRIGNAWTKFLGQLDETGGATASIAGGLNKIAANMQEIVNTGFALVKILGAVYAAKFITGITATTAAYIDNAIAQRAATVASQLLMQQEIRRAEVAVATSLNLVKEAQLQRVLATTEAQRVVAMRALDAAYAKHEANVAALQAQHAALNATMVRGRISALLFGDAVGTAGKAMALLNRAFAAFIAWEIGKTVGEWMNQFEKIRQAGSYVAETFVLIGTGFQAMFNRLSLQERFDQVKAIHAEFNQIRSNDTDSARKAASNIVQTEKLKADAAEEATERQTKAFKQVQEFLKTNLSLLTENYQRELDSFDRTEQQKLLIAESSGRSRQAIERDILRISLGSDRDKINAAKKLANDSLNLVKAAYDNEIAAAKAKNRSTAALENEYRDARKAILVEVEKAYAQSIDKLIALEQKHRDKALEYANELLTIEQRRADNLQTLNEIGLSDEEKLAARREQLAKDTIKVKELAAQGEYEKAKELSEKTEQLAFDIAQADKEAVLAGTGLNFDATLAREQYNAAVDQTKQITEQLAALETARAQQVKAQASEQQKVLTGVQQQLSAINEAIKAAAELAIKVDSTEVQGALDLINKIPTEKIITIKTVTEGGTPIESTVPILPGFSKGVRLTGFGGGDKILSLLEAGEGVLNKEALKNLDKTFGAGFFDGLNAKINPAKLLPNLAPGKLSIKANLPKLAFAGFPSIPPPGINPAFSGGKPGGSQSVINITLPGGQSFGPFAGESAQAESLAKALRREVLKRGKRA